MATLRKKWENVNGRSGLGQMWGLVAIDDSVSSGHVPGYAGSFVPFLGL